MAKAEPTITAPLELPVINISEATPTVGKAMIDAATKYGFFYVDSASSDFSNDDVESAFAMAREFFASPYEEKAAVKIGTDNRGWTGMHAEMLDPEHQQRGDFKEAMNFGEFKYNKPQQKLPKSFVPREAELARFMDLCRKTCVRILTLLALGLDIPENWFTSRHDPAVGPSGCTFRFLYYPSIDSPAASTFKHDVDVRAGAHSDYGSITLLFQRDGQPGLEILTPTGEWAPVPVRPPPPPAAAAAVRGGAGGGNCSDAIFPPILINIGDVLSYWTAGLLKSTVHRVVFPEEDQQQEEEGGVERSRDRYSMAYFCHPADNTELVPVPSQHVEERKRQNMMATSGWLQAGENGDDDDGRKPLTAREHLAGRLAATYGGSKEEYQ
ncbi:hypothetical protein AJ78_03836 [Emergomyces pasteurianus Ep9510]|uniref:Fe2OG dioxygenase domain-containing protein n=1 Tax=Emergomyces pasteurianus Ep9510 TaxID=1447872 RepID=A0A1J9QIH0_9EURO|nr:hypothetical protein AJ78_03836 [Emergomyces pasteurianus Ep9510]